MATPVAATPKQARFAALYLTGQMSAADCYRIVYSPRKATAKTIQEAASRLVRNGKVAALIEQGRAKLAEVVALDQAQMIKLWTGAALTDRNELVEVRRGCCRYCHGREFRFQERPSEREHRLAEYMKATAKPAPKGASWPPFDELGGIGFNANRDPNPRCPECDGDGVERTIIKDSRKLTPEAKALYEGVDVKNGKVVVNIRGREAAEEKLAKSMGLLVDKSLVGILTPEAPISKDVPEDPAEAARFYARIAAG